MQVEDGWATTTITRARAMWTTLARTGPKAKKVPDSHGFEGVAQMIRRRDFILDKASLPYLPQDFGVRV